MTERITMGRRELLRFGGLAVAGISVPGLLTACKAGSNPASKAGNVLRVTQPADATTLDPHKQGDLPSMNVLINIFDTLTVRDVNDRLVGGIAESWESVSPTTWRFHLRSGVTFHNGEPCDAAAVAYSLQRLIDPATKSPIVELRFVTKAKVVDARTVDVITSQPDPILPQKVSLFGGVIVPPKYIKEKGDAAFAANPVGTGPYVFQSWQRDNQIVLKANPKYWGGKPGVEQVTFKVMPDAASSLAALQSGGVDIVSQLSPDAAQQLGNGPGLKVVTSPGIRTFFVSIDTLSGGPLGKKEVRQALNMALDVPTLIKSVLNGAGQQTPTLIPHQSFGYDPSVQAFPYDLAKAKNLLAQAGYPNGFTTKLTASAVDKDMAQAISGQLAKIGVTASVSIMDAATFKQRLVSSNKQALGPMYFTGNTGWTMDAESNLQSFIRHDRRQSRWNNPQADKLIDTEEGSVDSATRKQAFTKLQQLLVDEAPFLFLYQARSLFAVNDRVQWKTNSNGTLAMASAKLT
ncbi:ABC transporter substrate-binding protein [Actinoallomurus iriomotensis]|uniref:ABC transporter substrate-binding protein n=1 Tax=Actinoallomurus iriomotensis TaxID=478107 RepID=A0A9W6RQ09_9ACTN|nr:ABC transporter substrate-binding protein [Actinoallomurus iriomotensis]GLY79320.1 ABC transporter substrate-binding protein [Actinoallomurus iriomotensis]